MAEEKEEKVNKDLTVIRDINLKEFNEPTEMLGLKVFLNLGEGRRLKNVFNAFRFRFGEASVTLRTIENWSSKNGWIVKADKFDQDQYEQLMKAELKKAMKSKINVVTICRALILRFGKRLQIGGGYEPNAKDFELAYKMMKQELGEGLPEWGDVKKINLIAVFQQIIKEGNVKRSREKENEARGLDD